MNLEEMKTKIYSMIEEYDENSDDLTADEDLALKMNSVINQIQNEICRMKKLPAYTTKEVEEGQELTINALKWKGTANTVYFVEYKTNCTKKAYKIVTVK